MSHLQALILKAKVQEQINTTESSFLHAPEDLSTLCSAQESLNHRLTFKKRLWYRTKSNKSLTPRKFCTSTTGICPICPCLKCEERNY